MMKKNKKILKRKITKWMINHSLMKAWKRIA